MTLLAIVAVCLTVDTHHRHGTQPGFCRRLHRLRLLLCCHQPGLLCVASLKSDPCVGFASAAALMHHLRLRNLLMDDCANDQTAVLLHGDTLLDLQCRKHAHFGMSPLTTFSGPKPWSVVSPKR